MPTRRYIVRRPHNTETCDCGYQRVVKDHGTWEGYYCARCGAGGSRQKNRQMARPSTRARAARVAYENRREQLSCSQIAVAQKPISKKELMTYEEYDQMPESRIANYMICDFRTNQDAMGQRKDGDSIQLICEASDFQISVVDRTGVVALCLKGVIIFNFEKIDYNGIGNDREVAGCRYTTPSGKYKLLIIND